MKKTALLSAAILTLAAGSPAAMAQTDTLSTLSGNTAAALLTSSTNQGSAPQGAQMQLSIVLRTHPFQGLTLPEYVAATETPGSPFYHQFLSASQLAADFSPSQGQVAQVVNFLQASGLTVIDTYPDRLVIRAQGPVGAVERTFNVSINQYMHGAIPFLGNAGDPQVPSGISGLILGIAGLTTYSHFSTHRIQAQSVTGQPVPQGGATPSGAPNEVPGWYGPAKVTGYYGVTPLYADGATGQGQTVAIATLANFNPSDAVTYWKAYGIPASPSRIQVIPVNGGFPAGTPAPGAGETTLDVEQSGSVAPGATIDVFEAPNTSTGFVDVFYKAASAGTASALSTSWGEPETDQTPAYRAMLNQAFLCAAAEGTSTFAAAGDNGAYDSGTHQLSVDSPASDPFVTAAGGTMYPGPTLFNLANFPVERAWGWDWLIPYYSDFGYHSANAFRKVLFPVGGGGGVSAVWPMPWYQADVPGVNPGGRNLPDVSLNADPFTGYSLYDTFGAGNNGWQGGWGGTSFVAPQLAGMTAVLDSAVGGRMGFLNPMLYRLLQKPGAYGKPNSPFNDITAGDNWYYYAVPGYDNATGIGSVNLGNLAQAIQKIK